MGQCVSQGITLGGTILKHLGIHKILNQILLNTMTWLSWLPLHWWQPVHVIPVIASSSNCSHFSGHPASKSLSTWAGIAAQNSREGGHHCQEATCPLKPLSRGVCRSTSCEQYHWEIVLCFQHTWSVVTNKLNPSAFPRLSTHSLAFQSSIPGPTDRVFNCNWQSFCFSPCFQSWETSKIRRKNHDYFSLRSRTGNRLQEKSF